MAFNENWFVAQKQWYYCKKIIIIIKPQDQATMIDNPRPTSELCMTPGSANKSTLQKSNPHIMQYKKSHAKQIFTEVRIIFTDR